MLIKRTLLIVLILIAGSFAACSKKNPESEVRPTAPPNSKDKPFSKGGAKEKELPSPPSPFKQ
jgi:hypothetical protein